MEQALKGAADDWAYRVAERSRCKHNRQSKDLVANQRMVEARRFQKKKALLIKLGLPEDLDPLGMLEAAVAIMENTNAT